MSSDASHSAATEEQTLAGTQATIGPRTPSHVVLARGQTVGRYLVLAELGRGTMGAVYDAYDADLDRRVALKLIAEPLTAEGQRQRLLAEAQLMAKISHPNVVTVFDVGVWQDRLYVAMELVEGITLDRWCALPGRTTEQVLDAFASAAAGLAAAHDAGVVHRDFKPTNVLVSDDGRVRVADFGIAQRGLSESGANTDEDPPPQPRGVGTPAYMSPEQWARAPVDARSDQFSFCVALFDALFGRRPFVGDSPLELAAAVSLGRIADHDAGRVDARVRAVVLQGLAVAPADRHASMHTLLAALADARRRRWGWRSAAVAAALVAASVGAWATRQPAPADACGGSARIDALWNPAVRQAIDLDATDVHAAFARTQREVLLAGLDRYAERWNTLHHDVCRLAAASPDSAVVRAQQSCTEDRFVALSGTITALRNRPIDAKRVDAALEVLPDLDACAGETNDWEPVPADPEQARQVAELRDRLVAVRIGRRAGRRGTDVAAIEAIAATAEIVGFPHLVAGANIELAAHYEDSGRHGDAHAAVQRALTVATAASEDEMMASAINRLLLVRDATRMDAAELRRWAALGDAICRRAALRGGRRGDIHNNLGLALRDVGDNDGALAACHDAQLAYADDDGPDGRLVTRARVNCVGTLINAGRYAEARVEAEAVLERLDELQPATSTANIAAVEHLAAARLYTADRLGSVAMLEEALRRRLLVTGLEGREVAKLLPNVALGRALTGDIAGAREAVAQARQVDPDRPVPPAMAEVVIAGHRRDADELRRALEHARALPGLDPLHLQLMNNLEATYAAAAGQPARALALLEPLCGVGDPLPPLTPASCCGAALVTAVLARDPEAIATWSARVDQTEPSDAEDILIVDVARAVAARTATPVELATLRARVDTFIATSHRDHPTARLLVAGLDTLGDAPPIGAAPPSSARPSSP